MRIIDRQGRLFGKINIIDFLVILLLLCFMPMFCYGYKLYIATKATERQLTLDAQREKEVLERRINKDVKTEDNLLSVDQDKIVAGIPALKRNIESEFKQFSINQNDIITRVEILEKKVDSILSSTNLKKLRKKKN